MQTQPRLNVLASHTTLLTTMTCLLNKQTKKNMNFNEFGFIFPSSVHVHRVFYILLWLNVSSQVVYISIEWTNSKPKCVYFGDASRMRTRIFTISEQSNWRRIISVCVSLRIVAKQTAHNVILFQIKTLSRPLPMAIETSIARCVGAHAPTHICVVASMRLYASYCTSP